MQGGFRPGRSTVDQVLFLLQSITDSFHQSKPGACSVHTTADFAKAFDSVWNSALLSKLLSFGLLLCFGKWIRSYLLDRRLKVRIYNSHSRPFRLCRGVSQGSVLKPVLFSLFINDFPAFFQLLNSPLSSDNLAIRPLPKNVECATTTV